MKLNLTNLTSESEGLLSSIMHLMPDGLLILNSSNQIIEANESAGRILGWSNSHDLIGKSFSDVFADADEMENFFSRLIKCKSLSNQASSFLRANGQTFMTLYSALQEFDDQHQLVRKVIIIRDITKQLNTQEKLLKSIRYSKKISTEFDQFIYSVSHDLKAPLRGISNLSDWIQEDIGTTIAGEVESNLKLLKSRVNRLEEMISGLSEFAKINKHKTVLENVDVSVLVFEVLNQLSISSCITIETAKELPVLYTSKAALKTVFMSLIENAVKFNDKSNGHVSIHSNDNGAQHEFTVEDDGPGIAPEYRKKVFHLFQTLQPKDKTGSIGLGLALASRIVDEYGGKILLKDSATGGCQFTFTWPKY